MRIWDCLLQIHYTPLCSQHATYWRKHARFCTAKAMALKVPYAFVPSMSNQSMAPNIADVLLHAITVHCTESLYPALTTLSGLTTHSTLQSNAMYCVPKLPSLCGFHFVGLWWLLWIDTFWADAGLSLMASPFLAILFCIRVFRAYI